MEPDYTPKVATADSERGVSIVCCGLSTVDIQLHSCLIPTTLEQVTPFSHTTTTAGGSAPQTALSLSSLNIRSAVLTVVGADSYAQSLRSQLIDADIDTRGVLENAASCTALAILPLFVDGRRGCFVTLGANSNATPESILPPSLMPKLLTDRLRVFHFGYPHLMPHLQGNSLGSLFQKVRQAVPHVLFTLDVNGANVADDDTHVLTQVLPYVAMVHANLDEACIVTGLADATASDTLPASEIQPVSEWFVNRGAAISCVTCGRDGVFVATSDATGLSNHDALSEKLQPNVFLHRSAFAVSAQIKVNASGAGDAFCAGAIAHLAGHTGLSGIVRLIDCGLASALHRIDHTLLPGPANMDIVLKAASERERIEPRQSLLLTDYSFPTKEVLTSPV